MHETERDRGALAQAFDVQHRAALVGFDWSEPGGALEKVREETDEVAALIAGRGAEVGEVGGVAGVGGAAGAGGAGPQSEAGVGAGAGVEEEGGREPGGWAGAGTGKKPEGGRESRVADEVGDLLFAVVNLARLTGVDPAAALSRATAKFERRFAQVRRLAEERGLPMPGTPLGPLDRLWDEVKERGEDRRS